jgi:carboxymethylenebutenolidase
LHGRIDGGAHGGAVPEASCRGRELSRRPARDRRPQEPASSVGQITAALYFGHADQDQGMPLAAIEQLEAALQEAGTRYQSELYEGARHGFTMPDLPAYDEAACDQHWDRLWSLFERTLL